MLHLRHDSERAKIVIGKLNGMKICILPESTLHASIYQNINYTPGFSKAIFNTKMLDCVTLATADFIILWNQILCDTDQYPGKLYLKLN